MSIAHALVVNILIPCCVCEAFIVAHTMLELRPILHTLLKLLHVISKVSIVETRWAQMLLTFLLLNFLICFRDQTGCPD